MGERAPADPLLRAYGRPASTNFCLTAWIGDMFCSSTSVVFIDTAKDSLGGSGVAGGSATPPVQTASAPFVTTKRRNPFGGAMARGRNDKRAKIDGQLQADA